MKRVIKVTALILVMSMLLSSTAFALGISADVTVTADFAQQTAINKDLFGIFFEDINYAADGGLNSNMVNNGSFEFRYNDNEDDALKLTGWNINGNAAICKTHPLNASNKTCLAVTGNCVIQNCGFPDRDYDYSQPDSQFGIYVTKGDKYELSFFAHGAEFDGDIAVSLLDDEGRNLMKEVFIASPDGGYNKTVAVVTASRTGAAKLTFDIKGNGTVYLDSFRFIPCSSYGYGEAEWGDCSLRADLFEALKSLSPKFVRFPGGCVAEGCRDWESAYNWKKTIGKVEERTQIPNLWGYNQSVELGYYEYFLLCEAIGSQPLPVVHAGLMCQARGNEYLELDSPEFAQHVQDVLDLVEYANGSVSSTWGAVRAQNGHPEPFNLKYLAIGNENWDEVYFDRFDVIYNAVKAQYPDIVIITSAGPSRDGEMYDYAWEQIDEKYTDTIVDEHYYVEPGWFLDNDDRYDSFDRNGAKVFAGEYAAHRGGGAQLTKSNVQTALAEAAYMTGLERNGDVVSLASYAPLFARYGYTQWEPNLIWFDSDEVIKTVNYYVQQLYMQNTGNAVLKSEHSAAGDRFYSVASVDRDSEMIYVKVVNYTADSLDVNLKLGNISTLGSFSEIRYIGNGLYNIANTFDMPELVTPRVAYTDVKNGEINYKVGPYSLYVFRIGYGGNGSVRGESDSGYRMGTRLETAFFEYLAKLVIWFKSVIGI